jgi:hypothetical protein
MPSRTRLIELRFEPEARFALHPATAPFRATLDDELDRLKDRLLRQYLSANAEPGYNSLLRQAANEAVALACHHALPLLLLPALFDEKAREARRVSARQNLVRSRSAHLMEEVA